MTILVYIIYMHIAEMQSNGMETIEHEWTIKFVCARYVSEHVYCIYYIYIYDILIYLEHMAVDSAEVRQQRQEKKRSRTNTFFAHVFREKLYPLK